MNMMPYTAPTSSTGNGSSCPTSGNWFSRRRAWILGGGVVAAILALAVSQHWLAAADLTVLLFLAPCALMMLMCMKGMNHGQQTAGNQASPNTKGPT